MFRKNDNDSRDGEAQHSHPPAVRLWKVVRVTFRRTMKANMVNCGIGWFQEGLLDKSDVEPAQTCTYSVRKEEEKME